MSANESGARIGLYPGTFDPVTLGHADIIRRGAKLVDRLIIGVTTNPSKDPMFAPDERIEMVRAEVAAQGLGNVEVRGFDALLMKFAESVGASGANGMAGGQMMDIAVEGAVVDLRTVTRLQQLKTGALLAAAVEMGAILGRVPEEGRAHLRAYARDIGLAFQIADDLLDHEGDEAKAGKALRKDARQGKATFVSLMGPDQARQQAHALSEQAIGHLNGHGEEADILRALARFVVERES